MIKLEYQKALLLISQMLGLDISKKTRQAPDVFARTMIAVALMRQGYTNGHVSKVMGKHHTTIVHYIRLHNKAQQYDDYYSMAYREAFEEFYNAYMKGGPVKFKKKPFEYLRMLYSCKRKKAEMKRNYA